MAALFSQLSPRSQNLVRHWPFGSGRIFCTSASDESLPAVHVNMDETNVKLHVEAPKGNLTSVARARKRSAQGLTLAIPRSKILLGSSSLYSFLSFVLLTGGGAEVLHACICLSQVTWRYRCSCLLCFSARSGHCFASAERRFWLKTQYCLKASV